jgi:hypothetical protein
MKKAGAGKFLQPPWRALSAIAELFVTCLRIASAMMTASSVARENQANGMFPNLSWIYCAGVKIMDNSI